MPEADKKITSSERREASQERAGRSGGATQFEDMRQNLEATRDVGERIAQQTGDAAQQMLEALRTYGEIAQRMAAGAGRLASAPLARHSEPAGADHSQHTTGSGSSSQPSMGSGSSESDKMLKDAQKDAEKPEKKN